MGLWGVGIWGGCGGVQGQDVGGMGFYGVMGLRLWGGGVWGDEYMGGYGGLGGL